MQVTGHTAVTHGYDDADRPTSVPQGASEVSFDYDVAGRRTKATLPNLVTIAHAWDTPA
jgi:YD repeat-containing protein